MGGELFFKELIVYLTTAKMEGIKFSSQIYWYMNKKQSEQCRI